MMAIMFCLLLWMSWMDLGRRSVFLEFGFRGVPSVGVAMHFNCAWAWCGNGLLVWLFGCMGHVVAWLHRKHDLFYFA